MHPYRQFPDRQFWNRAVSVTPWAEVFLGQPSKFKLDRKQRIASAGSCFARRIAEHLTTAGYNSGAFETAHPIMEAKSAEYGYGVFSCRYGNIYTARQLRQLFDEAMGVRPPVLAFLHAGPEKFIDLMRPNINQAGFATAEEARADRIHHLYRVRQMIREMEVFVFTLGLTEAWADQDHNIVYGSHPAVFRETVKVDNIVPINIEYEQVVADLEYVLALIARHNQREAPKVILTVSPVGLAATHQDSHVLTATSYSKSVLRAAAGKVAKAHANVDYFPSYEIFSLSQSFGQFLADDLRDVNPRGVAVAMRTFEDMFLEGGEAPAKAKAPKAAKPAAPAPEKDGPNPAAAECDEIANAFFWKKT